LIANSFRLEMSKWISTRESTHLITDLSSIGLRKFHFFFQKQVELNMAHLTHESSRFESGWGWVNPQPAINFFTLFFNFFYYNYLQLLII